LRFTAETNGRGADSGNPLRGTQIRSRCSHRQVTGDHEPAVRRCIQRSRADLVLIFLNSWSNSRKEATSPSAPKVNMMGWSHRNGEPLSLLIRNVWKWKWFSGLLNRFHWS
jgi:hypothetical protein